MSSLNKAKFKELEKKSSKIKSEKADIGNFIDNELKIIKKTNINNPVNSNINNNTNTNKDKFQINQGNNLTTKSSLLKTSDKEAPLKIPSNLRIGINKTDKQITAIALNKLFNFKQNLIK